MFRKMCIPKKGKLTVSYLFYTLTTAVKVICAAVLESLFRLRIINTFLKQSEANFSKIKKGQRHLLSCSERPVQTSPHRCHDCSYMGHISLKNNSVLQHP